MSDMAIYRQPRPDALLLGHENCPVRRIRNLGLFLIHDGTVVAYRPRPTLFRQGGR